MTALLESYIVLIRHPVKAMDNKAFREQELGKMEADKTSGAGN